MVSFLDILEGSESNTKNVRSIASMQIFSNIHECFQYTSFLNSIYSAGFHVFYCNPAEDTSLVGYYGLSSSKILPIDMSQISKNLPKIFCFQNCLNYSYVHVHARFHIGLYTECSRMNVPDFGRVFLMLKYTDITQNTCVQT